MWHLVHNQGIVRDDYIVIKMESKWLLLCDNFTKFKDFITEPKLFF